MAVDLKQFVEGVKKHALEHYNEDGWDFCVEAMDDNEVLDILKDPIDQVPVTDLELAIKAVGFVCKLQDDRRRDIRATAW